MWFIFFLIVAALAFSAHRAARKSGSRIPSQNRLVGLAPLVGILALLAALFSCLTVVPAGNVGVVDFFGRVSPYTLKAGNQSG